jgi:DNA modification methylase
MFDAVSETRWNRRSSNDVNRLSDEDQPVHNWYRFVLSYPPHLVRDYLARFGLGEGQRVLDPFCGTGTTVVEAKKCGIASVGIEANPMAHFASQVKLDWTPDPAELLAQATRIARAVEAELARQGIEDQPLLHIPVEPSRLRGLDEELANLLLKDSISPLPLHKALLLRDQILAMGDRPNRRHLLLALARVLVFSASNLQFGPEVGVGPRKADAAVVHPWLVQVRTMAEDLGRVRERVAVEGLVQHADARDVGAILRPQSVDAVITSPPYPNEKDYTRTTRLESVLLGFVANKAELQLLKRGLVRSNTRGVYKGDNDDTWVAYHPEIQRIADQIEARRIELNKTSGFERMYARVTRLYFGGMARHLAELRPALRPGAQLAYVVGDQASYLRVMIRTGQLLGEIAQALGYELVGIDLFRTRLATATKEQLREEVVVLRWPG